jgi:hypothetical protein
MRLYWLVLLTGCAADQAAPGGGSLTLQLSAPSPFDRVLVFARGIEIGGDAIATPGLLAAGVAPPATASVWQTGIEFPRADLASPASSYIYRYSSAEVGFTLDGVAAIVRVEPAGSSFAFGETDFSQDIASYQATLALHGGVSTELWGPPGQPQTSCLRVVNGSTTEYIVDIADRDCDGQPDSIDCQPSAYCDPFTTSGPAQSACACP